MQFPVEGREYGRMGEGGKRRRGEDEACVLKRLDLTFFTIFAHRKNGALVLKLRCTRSVDRVAR